MGTPPVPNCRTAEAGLGIISGIGTAPDRSLRPRPITQAIDRLTAIGCKFSMPVDPAKARPALVSGKSTDDHALVAALDTRNIVVSNRDGNVRCMFHAYNDMSDVDALISGLEANRSLLRCSCTDAQSSGPNGREGPLGHATGDASG